ncbi:polysaccharide deacetylase family protein [Novosphingobium sp.]|jgi:peptidoglycan/xylan/chitin deacetylase (PgdA/CDA1 family)|uniref:polysaccharide deacetylase family protein n=1 Tax=Novosphingobium sp. TaxID=1874826 RepID=UPI003562ECC2
MPLQEERIDWPNGAACALSIVVNVEEGSEQSLARGDKGMEPVDELGVFVKGPVRNYANESNYLYGIKAGAPRVIKLLKQYDIAASWTVAAMSLETHPELAQAIVELGHEPVSHGYRWVHQFRMDEEAERAFIRKAVESITQTCGVRPYGWLSRYLYTENTRRLLIEEGFAYHMDDFSGDVPFWDRDTVPGKPIAIVPYQVDSNDMKMWTDQAFGPEQWLAYAVRNFDQVLREGREGNPKMMSLGLHLRIIGRAGRIWALEQFLAHVRKHDDVWIATRHQIAQALAAVDPA